MRFLSAFFLFVAAFFVLTPWNLAQAHPCDAYLASPAAKNAAEDKADVYAAYAFGLKIQDAVRRKDAKSLLALRP